MGLLQAQLGTQDPQGLPYDQKTVHKIPSSDNSFFFAGASEVNIKLVTAAILISPHCWKHPVLSVTWHTAPPRSRGDQRSASSPSPCPWAAPPSPPHILNKWIQNPSFTLIYTHPPSSRRRSPTETLV